MSTLIAILTKFATLMDIVKTRLAQQKMTMSAEPTTATQELVKSATKVILANPMEVLNTIVLTTNALHLTVTPIIFGPPVLQMSTATPISSSVSNKCALTEIPTAGQDFATLITKNVFLVAV
jgi:hypothetical protein